MLSKLWYGSCYIYDICQGLAIHIYSIQCVFLPLFVTIVTRLLMCKVLNISILYY